MHMFFYLNLQILTLYRFSLKLSSLASKNTMSWIPVLLFISLLISGSLGEKIYVNQSSPNSVDSSTCGDIDKPCATFDLGLIGLQKLLAKYGNNEVFEMIIAAGNYTFNTTESGNFFKATNIAIIGVPHNTVSVKCIDLVGFSFVYSRNITVRGITFDGCSQLRNSTSANFRERVFIPTYVSLYFLYCEDVTITDVVIENTQGIAVTLYNVIGQSRIDSCTFHNNSFNNVISGGGGVYIEYSFCVPTENGPDCLASGKSNVDEKYTSNSMILVVNSNFVANVADLTQNVSTSYTFILPHKQYHSAFGRGGGISTFFKGNAQKNEIKIEKCNFAKNHALWGAGIFAEYQDNAGSNSFSVKDSVIKKNEVSFNDEHNEGTGGGGSRVGYIYFDDFFAYNNSITFENCTFDDNQAYYGGGISFYCARQPSQSKGYNNFTITNCSFQNNRARLGSAVDLSQWHSSINGAVLSPVIESCTFESNAPRNNGGLVGVGAVYVDALHLDLKGNVVFRKNMGSALAVTAAYIVIEANASILFEENSARNGGGIALLGNTYIVTYAHSNLTFINNIADYNGGAIYFFSSGERDLISSRNCLIRFFNITVPPQSWTSSFTFRGNKANNQNNSIYASSVLPCLWGGAFGSTSVNASEAFCWNEDNWVYYDDYDVRVYDCSSQISSAPSKFVFTNKETSNQTYIPGNVPIDLTSIFHVEDDFNIRRSAVLIASIRKNDTYRFQSEQNFNYISNENLYLFAEPNSNVTIQIETLDPIVVQKNITIAFQECPPGFNNTNQRCVCDHNYVYNEYVSCNAETYESSIARGAWMGACGASGNKPTDHLCVGLSPYVNTNTRYLSISLGYSIENLTNIFCSEKNRDGILCGKCQPNYGVAANSDNFVCVICKGDVRVNWFLYILTEFLPITFFFAAVFIFSMTLTSGPLNSFIFFAQVLNTGVKIGAEGMVPLGEFAHSKNFNYEILKTFYTVPYDIWNLDFFASLNNLVLELNFCLGESLSTLSLLTLRYVSALYPLLLLLVFIVVLTCYNQGRLVCIFRPVHNCLSRLRQHTGINQSITGGFAVFILISYTKFTLISNMLLSSSPLYYSNSSMSRKVFYFDGEVDFPSNIHQGLGYIILAVLIYCTFVAIPPILLVYPSILKLLEKVSKGRIPVGRLYPHHKIQLFLNEFHGCYRDGSDGRMDCRWFASLYFFLRIIIFIMYGQINQWSTQYVIQILVFLTMAVLFVVFQPYRQEWINSLDAAMFVNLAAISAISLYNLQQSRIGENLSIIPFILQMILVFLPLIYCVVYYCTILIKPRIHGWVVKKKRKSRLRLNRPVDCEHDRIFDSSAGESDLEDSTHVEPFLDYINNNDRNITNRLTRRKEVHVRNINSTPSNSETTPLCTGESGLGSVDETPSSTNPSYGAAEKKK